MIMKPARLIILTVAVVAAGLSGLLALRMSDSSPVQVADIAPVIEREPTGNVLVIVGNMPVGSRLTDASMKWVNWPKAGIGPGVITQDTRPQAMTELVGSIVRLPMFDGEPIRPEKIADASNRIMSSLLPAGKRAVATDITVSTGAGGFILPNDRVDVIMVNKADGKNYKTQTVLTNVRVLAIDQNIQEKDDGSKTVVGTTATLELTPDQAKVIAISQQMADRLTLSLRSVADAQDPDTEIPENMLGGEMTTGSIQVIKSGEIVKSSETQ
jgi:pilus assembly protein CpaB